MWGNNTAQGLGLFIWARVEDAAPILLEIWRVESLGVGGFIHLNRGGRILIFTLCSDEIFFYERSSQGLTKRIYPK